MSWASWANRAYVVGAGRSRCPRRRCSSSPPAPAQPRQRRRLPPRHRRRRSWAGSPGWGGLGGLDVSVGGINVSVLDNSGSTIGSTSASGGTLGGVVGSTLNGVLGSVLGNGRPKTDDRPPSTYPTRRDADTDARLVLADRDSPGSDARHLDSARVASPQLACPGRRVQTAHPPDSLGPRHEPARGCDQ